MKLNICFLGTGKINSRHVGIVKKARPRARLAVASRDKGRAGAFLKKFNLDHAFGSYQEAMDSDYNTLVVGVPPKHHFPLVQSGLKYGKNLLIEKPAFDSLQEFQRLWTELESSRGIAMVAENQHFDPFHRKIKHYLETGVLGKALSLELTRVGVRRGSDWRQDASEMSLGALHEGGIHWIRRVLDLANVFEEDPYRSVSELRAWAPERPFSKTPHEDTVIVTAYHRSGLISRLFHSWGIPQRNRLMEFSRIYLEYGVIYFDGRGAFGWSQGKDLRVFWPGLSDLGGYKAMWNHYLSCLEEEKKPDLSLKDLYYDFAFMDAAYRSLQSGSVESPRRFPGET